MTSVPLADGREHVPEPTAPARRPLRARVSSGHLVMVLAGLVAMLLNYQVLRAGEAGTRVAVLDRDVAAGEPVTAGHVRFAEIDAAGEVLAALVTTDRVDSLEGHVASADLPAGSMLRARDLRPVAAPGGRRAMSIPIDAEHAAAGRIEVGDRIDVIEVRDERAAYLLAGAPVIDVASPEGRAGIAASRAFAVTVAVDAEDALRLALAIRAGSLEVVRSTGAPPPAVTRVQRDPAPRPGAGGGAPGGGGAP